MGFTTVDLYRAGTKASARLDRVRPQDVTVFVRQGVDWVRAGTGGVSTDETQKDLNGPWWLLPAGTLYDDKLLFVWNNQGTHWQWEPAVDMTLSDYIAELAKVNVLFIRV